MQVGNYTPHILALFFASNDMMWIDLSKQHLVGLDLTIWTLAHEYMFMDCWLQEEQS